MVRRFSVISLLFLTLSPACAQENASAGAPSRSAQIEEERERKAARLKPDKPEKTERRFIQIKSVGDYVLAAPPAGIRPKFSSRAPGWGGLVLGSGLSLGPEYYRPDL